MTEIENCRIDQCLPGRGQGQEGNGSGYKGQHERSLWDANVDCQFQYPSLKH